MNLKKFETLFPLGSHLCREPMPAMSELKKDMENLKRHGFNLIKLQEHWQIDEPLEGRYDFSRCQELIEHAARLDLGVYLGLTCEHAPNWLWEKYPDCRMVMLNGLPLACQPQTTLPADGKPGPCFDHPGVSAEQERFLRKLVETLGACENIVVWNTWQEISTNAWLERLTGGQPVCYCENTLNFFREWLREKYKDLDGLNRAWNTRYLDWRYVFPERDCPRKRINPHNIDWNFFMENMVIARVLQERYRVIRAADPFKRPIFAHFANPTIGSSAGWVYSRCQDFIGSSAYPSVVRWFHQWDDVSVNNEATRKKDLALWGETCESVALIFDYIRSCNRSGTPIWAAEFQGGPGNTGDLRKGRVPSSEDIRRWMLSAVAHGVTGISFWLVRAEIAADEHNGFSFLDSEGDTTERFEEAARIGRALNRHADIFGKPSGSGANVAILINECNFQGCELMLPPTGEHLRYNIRGWHRLLWEQGIPADFLDAAALGDDGRAKYKVLILPFPLFLSEETAEKLAGYVKAGGTLISEAAAGRFNEHGFCNRGELSPAVRKLFGVKQQSFVMVKEPGDARRWSVPPATWGDFSAPAMLVGCGPLRGQRLRANVYVETYLPENSRPCLNYGKAVAGVKREYGQGRAWLLGTYVGHNGTAYRNDATVACVMKILGEAGVKPEHKGKLLLRKRKGNSKEAWIFTNKEGRDIAEEINVKGWKRVADLLEGPLKISAGRVKIKVKRVDVKILILSRH